MLGNDWVTYHQLVERAENAMRSWDAIMTTAAQTFSALANVAARHEVDNQQTQTGSSSSGSSAQEEAAEQRLAKHSRPRARAVENAGKMEAYCVGLTRVVASLRDIANTLATISTDATTTYGRAAAHITQTVADGREQVRREAVQRGARAASVLDVVEALQAVAAAYEREYWVKQRIVGCALDVCRPQDMDVLLQSWAEDTQIAREELRALLRRAKGCAASLSVD